MSEDRRESPLAGFASLGRGREAGDPGVTMTERPFRGYVNLRGGLADPGLAEAVGSVLGTDVPLRPNTVASAGEVLVCWLGPDEWMAVAGPGSEGELISSLRKALEGRRAAATDTTGNYTTINLAGSRARDLLAKGCTLDLHPTVFAPGQCAQTNLAKAAVLLIPRSNDRSFQSFDVVVRRSFADYLAHWLEHSGWEYGFEVAAQEN